MSNNTFTLQNIDKVNFYGTDSGADVYLEGVSTGTSGVCVSGSLLVNGDYINFGSSLGTSGYGFHNDSGIIQFKNSGGNWTTLSGGVSGSNTQIQFNDNGSFGACAGFTFNKSSNQMDLEDGTIVLLTGGGPVINLNSSDSSNNSEASINLKTQSGTDDNIKIVSSDATSNGPAIKLFDETTASLEKTVEIMGTTNDDDNTHLGGKITLTKLDSSVGPTTKDIFEIDGANQRILMRDYDTGFSIKFGVSTSITQNSNFFLPDGNGVDGYVLSTDGSGNTSWVTQSGGGGGNPNGPENSVQFNSSSAFTGTSSFQFFEASPSTTGGVCALTVDGNVFSSMGVSDNTSAPIGTYTMTASEFVNGFVFPPCQSSDENQLFVVQVPSYTDITTVFSADVLKEGQTFDTVIYGTSIGSSAGVSYPSDITVLEGTSVIFDRRLVSDKTISNGLSFHFADATLPYYQGVVIRSRMGSNGVSMYPYATSFYTC